MKKGHLIIISGPSGVGKNVVEVRLRKLLPKLKRVITHTTRKIRRNEKNGRDYYFITKQLFKKMIAENKMLEWAVVHDNLYGSRHQDIDDLIKSGKTILMIVDVQGAVTIKKNLADSHLIFIEPESLDQLKKHLAKRKGMQEADLALRIKNAKKELAMRSFYDYTVVNKEGKVDKTAESIAKIIKKIKNTPHS